MVVQVTPLICLGSHNCDFFISKKFTTKANYILNHHNSDHDLPQTLYFGQECQFKRNSQVRTSLTPNHNLYYII